MAGLVVLIIAAGSWAAFTFAPRARPEASDSQFTQRLQTIESANQQMLARIEELAGLLNELKARPPQQQVQSNPAELDALKQQMSDINGRINTLSDALGGIESSLKTIEGGQGSQQKEIESTAQRIGEIQSQLKCRTGTSARRDRQHKCTRCGSGETEGSGKRGAAFRPGTADIQRARTGMEAAGSLQAYAGNGVATMADLSAKLQETLITLKTPAAPSREPLRKRGVGFAEGKGGIPHQRSQNR